MKPTAGRAQIQTTQERKQRVGDRPTNINRLGYPYFLDSIVTQVAPAKELALKSGGMGKLQALGGLLLAACVCAHSAAPALRTRTSVAPTLLWSTGGQYFAGPAHQGDRVAYEVRALLALVCCTRPRAQVVSRQKKLMRGCPERW